MSDTTPSSKWEPTALSRYIRRRIEEMGITQVELAGRLGVVQSYVSQIAAGRLPDVDAPGFIERYAKVLEVSPEELIAEGELWRYNVVPVEGIDPRVLRLHYKTRHLTDEQIDTLIAVAEMAAPHPKRTEGTEPHNGEKQGASSVLPSPPGPGEAEDM